MANPSKAKGTAWKSTWTRFVQEHHNPSAHRNVQMSCSKDIGDVAGYYLHASELKAEKTIRLPRTSSRRTGKPSTRSSRSASWSSSEFGRTSAPRIT